MLAFFVNRSTASGIFALGRSDLHIEGVHVAFEITVCHESDIHFESPDVSLVSRVTTSWSASGLRSYEDS